jgi:hypothetical protein
MHGTNLLGDELAMVVKGRQGYRRGEIILAPGKGKACRRAALALFGRHLSHI